MAERDALVRIAVALERLVELVEPRPRRSQSEKPEIEVTDVDRAAARRLARKMGLYVKS